MPLRAISLPRLPGLLLAALIPFNAFGQAPALNQPPALGLDADGTLHIPPQTVPVSEFLSAEGRQYLVDHLHDLRNPALLGPGDGVPPLLVPYLERQRELFPTTREDTMIGGVHAYGTRLRLASRTPIATRC